jgi:basic amino acid/polyamine antiporter, APA family
MQFFRKKNVGDMVAETQKKEGSLQKVLGAMDLTALGIGCIIGTGIFVLTGIVAAEHAGPALILSFIISGFTCIFAALCYSELASSIPVSGSAYTYSYVAFGELIAWIIGWALVLEYGLAASAVASGWSGYFQGLFNGLGIHLPTAITSAYNPEKGTFIDIPAICIVMLITYLLSCGMQKSARINNIMVIVKIVIVLLFIVVGVWYVKPSNWTPFMPFGFSGVATGAATVFFAYLGFDSVASAAEEVKNPQRNMPIGIIASLVICTGLYIIVSLILTGIVPFTQLDVKDPVAFALRYIHQDGAAGLVSIGAITGMTTVLLVLIYAQSRLFFAMSRDGLMPKGMSKVDSIKKTPIANTWVTGTIVAIFGGLIPLDKLAELVNIGTLFAYIVVAIGVMVMRKTQPELHRPFKVPFVPVIPIIAVLCCGYLILQLPSTTWIGFGVWLIIGLFIYFGYGIKNSNLQKLATQNEQIQPDRKAL